MKMVPLGEVAEIVSGATPKTGNAEYWDGDVQWVTPADLSKLDGAYISETPRRLTAAGVRSCAATLLPVGSVLLSSRAPIGHVAINTVPMATNQGFKSLVPGARLDAKFLYRWLKSKTEYLKSLGNGATFKELSKGTAGRVEIPLPPLEEQRRVAAILDQADELRAKRRQALAQFDALVQSTFNIMFGVRDQVSLQLADVAQIWDCPHSTPKWTDSGEICLRTPNLSRGGWRWDDTRYVDAAQFETRSKGGGARAGDIILSREGTVGIAAIVQPGMGVCMGQRLVQVRVDQAKLVPEFALEFLLTALRPERISQLMVGSTAQHLNVKDLRALGIPIPPLSVQSQFTTRVRLIERQRDATLRALNLENDLFASLQSRAFRDEL